MDTTKIILALIAMALWLNLIEAWTRPASAQGTVDAYLSNIDVQLRAITNGTCKNTKVC